MKFLFFFLNFLVFVGVTNAFLSPNMASSKTLTTRQASALPVVNEHKEKDVNLYHLMKTAGGFLAQMKVNTPSHIEPSRHTIIVGDEFLAKVYSKISPDLETSNESTVRKFYDCVLDFMLDKGMNLKNTDGLVDASIFPVNYFTVQQLSYFYDDAVDQIAERLKRNL